MAFSFASAPTIAERVSRGLDAFRADDDAIGLFSDEWTLSDLDNNPIKATQKKLAELRATGFEITDLWFYHDEQGRRVSAALRLDNLEKGKKQVLPLRVFKRGNSLHWVGIKALSDPRPLYNLHHLADHPELPVLMVEGEKAAEAGAVLSGYVTTTWSGGASSVNKTDLRPLAGRNVIICPDNDEDGRSAADKLGPLLASVGAASVRVVRLPTSFPKKWDIADPFPVSEHG